jgi:hypothetical protein
MNSTCWRALPARHHHHGPAFHRRLRIARSTASHHTRPGRPAFRRLPDRCRLRLGWTPYRAGTATIPVAAAEESVPAAPDCSPLLAGSAAPSSPHLWARGLHRRPRHVRGHLAKVEMVMGATLVVTGIMFMTGAMQTYSIGCSRPSQSRQARLNPLCCRTERAAKCNRSCQHASGHQSLRFDTEPCSTSTRRCCKPCGPWR